MQKITKYLCGIIQQAAKITTKSFNIYAKDDCGDIVTDIDKTVESFIIEKLNQKYPEFDIVSEEFNADHDLTSHCFVIDPIDGTKNFAAGIPLWGMQIAAIENGEVISAVIYLPKLDELYYADCDGAFLNGARLEVAAEKPNQRPIYSVEGGNEFPALAQMKKDVGNTSRRVGASSVLFAWVAAGRLSGYSLSNPKVWDYLPGMYLVKTAGGYTNDDRDWHIAATSSKMLEILSGLPTTETNPVNPATETAVATQPKTATRKTTKVAKTAPKKSK